MRLREADSMAAMAELRQKIAELEIQVCPSVCITVSLYVCVICVCMHLDLHAAFNSLIDLTVP